MDLVKVRPGDVVYTGGCYAKVSDAGEVRLAVWSGSTEVALSLTAEQADALGDQLINRAAGGVTHAFGNAELCNVAFDLFARNPA